MTRTPRACCDHEHHPSAGWAGMLLEVGTLLAVAAFLAYSYATGRVVYFVAPAYVWLPLAAAVMLTAMAVARLIGRMRNARSCDCGHDDRRPISQFACVALLIAPVVMALSVDPQGFSLAGINKRRANLPGRDFRLERAVGWVLGEKVPDKKEMAAAVTLPKEPTVLELLVAIGKGHGEALEGRFVTMVGQCDLPPDTDVRRFGIYRLVVNCCIADATAVSIEVAAPSGVKLQSRGWIRVGGTIRFDSDLDPSLPVIHATTVTRIREPNTPYL